MEVETGKKKLAFIELSSRTYKCLDRSSVFIYLSHFLSSFGDRVWQFAIGLYLYYLSPCSLLLTAAYGLSTCSSLFLFGASVGRWVDKTKRLRAARVTILIQNLCVVISAIIIASAIYYKRQIKAAQNGLLEVGIYSTVIVLEVLAELASMANKLVLEKDWIVVLARGDKQKLSTLNATMRTINLSCQIVAPFAVGHLLDWFSYVTGAIFIASWNVISAIVEYYLLHAIFSLVPELSNKKATDEAPTWKIVTDAGNGSRHEGQISDARSNSKIGPKEGLDDENGNVTARPRPLKALNLDDSETVQAQPNNMTASTSTIVIKEYVRSGKPCRFLDAWRRYFSHPVRFAGLGLASLYMTVLCFDNVTIGYLSSQGVSAVLSGNLTAVSALVGILGSLSFPYLRRKLGKNKAGMVGFGLETLCLLFCVTSIIAPGSPFVYSSITRVFKETVYSDCQIKDTSEIPNSLSLKQLWEQHSNIFLLMIGMVFARYGLWIADLSVTQIFQEKVEESQRGVMGGVQSSLNEFMSLIKFIFTIVLPYPDMFGYLICLSWTFVFLGWILFMWYSFEDLSRKKSVSPAENCKQCGMGNDELVQIST